MSSLHLPPVIPSSGSSTSSSLSSSSIASASSASADISSANGSFEASLVDEKKRSSYRKREKRKRKRKRRRDNVSGGDNPVTDSNNDEAVAAVGRKGSKGSNEPLAGSSKKEKKRKRRDGDTKRENDGILQKRLTATPVSTAAASSSTSPVEETGDDSAKMKRMTDACRTILECIGEDPDREGLAKTPERWANALLFMSRGYQQSVAAVTNDAIFAEDHSEMVVVRDIDIHSLCEHHMVPFSGKVHVGYIPNGRVLGLSKIARIAEVYARRLQVQERLTRQIADAIVKAVSPLGVAVVVECRHFCMVMRGVEKCAASTVTSSVRGCFEKNSKTRAEFFSIVNSNRLS